MPGATSTVVYPQGAKFDMDYYLNTHMPLVQEHWGPFGLTSWKVLQFDDKDSPYGVQATLEWNSIDSFQKAASSDSAKTVLGDVPNFTDAKPTLMTGNILKASA